MKMTNQLMTALVLLFAASTTVSAQTNPVVKPRKTTSTAKPKNTARTQQRKSEQTKTDPDVIVFKQPSVEAICLQHFDINRDGKLTKQEAAEVMVFPDGIFKDKKDITYFDELQYFTALKRIPDNAFSQCSNLMRLTLPEGIDAIGNYAFYECANLTLVNIPSTVRRIGKSAFSGCKNLSCPIVIPEGVRVIEEWTFSNCNYVPSIALPSTLMEIKEAAFYDCESMTCLTVPAGLRELSDFWLYENLAELHFKSPTPPKFNATAYYYHLRLSEYTTVYVPRGSREAYQNWEGLKDFKGTIVEE